MDPYQAVDAVCIGQDRRWLGMDKEIEIILICKSGFEPRKTSLCIVHQVALLRTQMEVLYSPYT